MIVALGVLAVVVGALRPSAAKASVQFIVFMIIGANLAQAPIPSWIVVGYMALGTVPVWVTLAVVGLVGAVRGYLKAANYAAYMLVMTPLVTVLSGLGHPVRRRCCANAWSTR
jgi:hypothetical protein